MCIRARARPAGSRRSRRAARGWPGSRGGPRRRADRVDGVTGEQRPGLRVEDGHRRLVVARDAGDVERPIAEVEGHHLLRPRREAPPSNGVLEGPAHDRGVRAGSQSGDRRRRGRRGRACARPAGTAREVPACRPPAGRRSAGDPPLRRCRAAARDHRRAGGRGTVPRTCATCSAAGRTSSRRARAPARRGRRPARLGGGRGSTAPRSVGIDDDCRHSCNLAGRHPADHAP